MKYVSIPRLELIAATLSLKVSLLLRQELGIPINKEHFWTESKVLLGYTYNNSKNVRYLLETGFNSSEKMQIQSNGSMCQPRKIQQMTGPED